jgi:hypothetical protein
MWLRFSPADPSLKYEHFGHSLIPPGTHLPACIFRPACDNMCDSMGIHLSKTAAAYVIVIVGLAPAASSQTPSGAPASTVVANPTYVSIPLEVMVNRPAAEVWKRVGKYCDIGEWLQVPCTITSGKDGEVGTIRSIGNEILVGKTELSYTYTQPVREGRPYNLYHGTLEARPVTPTTSKLVYTLVFDNSTLADDAAREKDKTQRTARFTQALENMKILAEGGTLPPAPARGGPGPNAGTPKQ